MHPLNSQMFSFMLQYYGKFNDCMSEDVEIQKLSQASPFLILCYSEIIIAATLH